MSKRILPKTTEELIAKEIAKVFERLKIKLLNPYYKPKIDLGKEVKHDKFLSMPGLYYSAYVSANADSKPTQEALKGLMRVTENYIDNAQDRAKIRAIEAVENTVRDAQAKPDYDYEEELNDALVSVFDQTHGETKTILESELQRVKTIGLQEGTLDILEKRGITDPTIAFLTRHDSFVCKYCREMYTLPDGVTPRVYKLSELKSGYFNRKNPEPHLAPLHPNCFLTTDGRVYTDKGWKPLKYVGIGDKVLTHKLKFRKVINTLNWDQTLYRKDYYSVKLSPEETRTISVTPDHEFWTEDGFKKIKDIDPSKDRLMKLVHSCVYCNKKMNSDQPRIFCSPICRDHFLANVPDHIDKLEQVKYETEYFVPKNLIWHHKSTEPTFLHDITVEGDESFFLDGLSTKNCRCLMISILPNFGFDMAGKLQYVGPEHDEYDNQREFRKSLTNEQVNHDCSDHIIVK